MRMLILAVSLIAGLTAVQAAEPDTDTGAPAPAIEDPTAKLDDLFSQLQTAPAGGEAKLIERRILIEWMRSGDDEIDKMMNAAMMAMQMRAFAPALRLLDQVVDQKPDFIEGWNKRATLYYYVGEYDKSLIDIEHTLALDPRHFGALAGLGMIMQNTGNIPAAIAAFEQAVAVNPSLDNIKLAIEQLRARISRDI